MMEPWGSWVLQGNVKETLLTHEKKKLFQKKQLLKFLRKCFVWALTLNTNWTIKTKFFFSFSALWKIISLAIHDLWHLGITVNKVSNKVISRERPIPMLHVLFRWTSCGKRGNIFHEFMSKPAFQPLSLQTIHTFMSLSTVFCLWPTTCILRVNLHSYSMSIIVALNPTCARVQCIK